MKSVRVKNEAGLKRLLKGLESAARDRPGDEAKVRGILAEVRRGGDAALLRLARRHDGFSAGSASRLKVSRAELEAAYARVGRPFVKACEAVKANIEGYQRRLLPSSWRRELRPGVSLGLSVRAVRRAGLYVPGGSAPLASTVLMSALPAKVAGVAELVLCTPNRGRGVDPRILVAADLCRVDEIWQLGGAHAIAALAYGTATLRKVDFIAGPGSRWVNLAKKAVFGEVGLDSLAGPSEAMIVADDSAPPAFVAADLLSQAEHTGNETAVLVTPSARLARAAMKELKRQLARLPRRGEAARSLKARGLVAVVKDLAMALEVVNARGPEHLQLMVRGAEALIPKVRAAGAIFFGTYTPVAMGDFAAGPSHVLPTGATARFSSGLSAETFLVKSSLIGYRRESLRAEALEAVEFAKAEGLAAHERSISIRLGEQR